MRWVLVSPGIMFHEVAELVHLIDASKPAARKQAVRWIVPLGVPRLLERRPCLGVPRERSLSQRLARQSPPRLKNSWRFCVDLGYIGKSALSTGRIKPSLCTALSATSRGMGMTLGMTLIHPVQCRVATRRTRLTRCTCSMFCDDAGLFCDTGNYSIVISHRLKTFREPRKKRPKFWNFPRKAKKSSG